MGNTNLVAKRIAERVMVGIRNSITHPSTCNKTRMGQMMECSCGMRVDMSESDIENIAEQELDNHVAY
jgi:hypothetical protein